jgi:hypothetical protein
MGFKSTNVTFSRLRGMWKKKEDGQMYSGLQKVKLRDLIIEGMTKMELDAKEGRGYSSRI